MTRQKKWFGVLAAIFVMLLIFVSYDISRRTTFPGSKPQLKEQPIKEPLDQDTLKRDSTNAINSKSEMP